MKELTLFDGAFGTYFLSLHPDAGLPERANLTSPDDVAAIHREYIDSGSNAIKTNTFSVNSAFFSGEDLSKALRSGYEIAKLAAAERNVRVFADIGPISGENAEEDFLRQRSCPLPEQFLSSAQRAPAPASSQALPSVPTDTPAPVTAAASFSTQLSASAQTLWG